MQKRKEKQHSKYPLMLVTILAVVSLFVGSVAASVDKVVVIPLMGMSTVSGLIYNGINYGTVSHNGEIWMDRNLGAVRAAVSQSDFHARGDLYQWGRGMDGHEIRTSPTTEILSPSDTPGHGNFIVTDLEPFDWRNPQNNNLWQGVNGINNPCPAGFRLPTQTEWQTERTSWSSSNSAGAFASPLKIVVAGFRHRSDGIVTIASTFGFYWSATVNVTSSRAMVFSSGSSSMSSYNRAHGFSVRCLKD